MNYKKLANRVFDIYFAVGVAAMALMTFMVIFAVICRYFFSLSWKEVSEFNITLFAFTTFWGMGVNIMKGEHVRIDILYNAVKPVVRKCLSILDYAIVLVVDLVFTYQGYKYVAIAGKQISQGMEIPMKYMYGIMPVSGAVCAICALIKLVEAIFASVSSYKLEDESVKAGKGDAV